MTDHDHSWSPVLGRRARYSCTCGAEGYRARAGVIRPIRHPDRPEVAPTVRVSTVTDGAVPALPDLDEQERR